MHKKRNSKVRKFVQELAVELDKDEISERRARLVDTEHRMDLLEAERSKTLEALNDRKTKLALERKALLETLTAVPPTEKRPVDCEARIDFDRNREVIVRLDTDEQVEERALTGDERSDLSQEPMFGDGAESGQQKPEGRA